MLLSNLEYIPLRLLRKFVLRDALLLRFGAFFPYYRVNLNQADPIRLVDDYSRHLAHCGFQPQGRRILEIGVGRTNSVAYEMSARFAPSEVMALEPFVEFSPAEDARLLARIADQNRCPEGNLSARVRRIRELGEIPDGSIDLILSNSVLEHVNDPGALFTGLRRVLAAGGAMLHLVDYRDHFFKYPYHFLQFRKADWNRWLNPGDLPVWRIYDHLEQLERCGFSVSVLEETRDSIAYEKVAAYVSPAYRQGDERLQTATAVLWAVVSNLQ